MCRCAGWRGQLQPTTQPLHKPGGERQLTVFRVSTVSLLRRLQATTVPRELVWQVNRGVESKRRAVGLAGGGSGSGERMRSKL